MVIPGRSGNVPTMHSHTLLILAIGFADPAGRLRMWKSGSIGRARCQRMNDAQKELW